MACVVLGSGVSGEVYEVSKSSKPDIPLQRDNAKEVVIDPKTQLMWQDDASVKSVKKSGKGRGIIVLPFALQVMTIGAFQNA